VQDSIAEEEDLASPNLPHNHIHSRSSTPETGTARALRLWASNPDSPSSSPTEDDLLLPFGIPQPQPSYRSSRPIQPDSISYLGVSQHKISPSSPGIDEQSHNPEQPPRKQTSRKARLVPVITWRYDRNRPAEDEHQSDEDLFTNVLHTALSHWATYLVQGFVWIA
jgi:hypothetical protein